MAVDLLIQALAFQQLHGDEVLAVALFNGVDGADVGMVQAGSSSRLLFEAIES